MSPLGHEERLQSRQSREIHLPFQRRNLSGTVLGTATWSIMRSTDCQVNSSGPSRPRRLTLAVSAPAPVTPRASITQRLPSRSQRAWPWPPSLSKCQDRNYPVRGSRPIFIVPETLVFSLSFLANCPTKNA